jgi:signal peptidase I
MIDMSTVKTSMNRFRASAFALTVAFGAGPANAAEQFFAQTASMAPAILGGEAVALDKSAYLDREPTAGDIVVYTLSWSSTVPFAHRVIGVGGDTVQVTNGAVILNGKPLATADAGTYRSATKSIPQTRETLPNGRSYLVLHENPAAPQNNTAVYTVPAGHVFVMGDHRDVASDSRRKDGGFIPRAAIAGRLTTINSSSTDGREGTKLD